MLIEWILELKDSIDKHGLRLGVVFTLYAIYRKERRNNRLDKRDIELFRNQFVIMKALGVEQEWRGQREVSKSMEVQSLKKLYVLLRGKNMQTNWITLLPALLGAIKLILQMAKIDIPDEDLNEIANGVASLATVIGIFMSHKKQDNAQTYKGDSGQAV